MREVFNETGYERWTAEAITGSLTAHEAKEFHTIVIDDPQALDLYNGEITGDVTMTVTGQRNGIGSIPAVVYNIQPVSTSVERNMLTAKTAVVGEALTAAGPQRRSDRGDMVLTDARYWETRVARNGRGGQLDTVANALKAEAGSTGLGDAAPMVLTYNIIPEWGGGADLRAIETDVSNAVTVTDHAKKTDRGVRVVTNTRYAYSVDKERGIPNSEGIRVQEMSVSSTITADGDPTERTDRGMRVVGPTSQGVGQVRRLTPTECERLQGFPDSWTIVDPAEVKAMKARWVA